MIIIGMTGPIGHGKTTFADALQQLEPNMCHLESSAVIMEVADAWHAALAQPIDPYDIVQLNEWLKALPPILDQLLGVACSFDQLRLDQTDIEHNPVEYQKLLLYTDNLQRNFEMARQPITRQNKEQYRPLLQWLGGYLVKHVNQSIWYNEIVRRIKAAEAEGCPLCIVGGLRYPSDAALLRHNGAIIIKLYRPGQLQNDVLDPTERERDNIPVDVTIVNTGTQEDLAACAARFLEDIRVNKLERIYRTKSSE